MWTKNCWTNGFWTKWHWTKCYWTKCVWTNSTTPVSTGINALFTLVCPVCFCFCFCFCFFCGRLSDWNRPQKWAEFTQIFRIFGPSTPKASPRHATSTALVNILMTSELVSCNCAYLLSQKVSIERHCGSVGKSAGFQRERSPDRNLHRAKKKNHHCIMTDWLHVLCAWTRHFTLICLVHLSASGRYYSWENITI